MICSQLKITTLMDYDTRRADIFFYLTQIILATVSVCLIIHLQAQKTLPNYGKVQAHFQIQLNYLNNIQIRNSNIQAEKQNSTQRVIYKVT